MPDAKNPLDRLDHQELLWLVDILRDACREKLEKNLVSQEFEARLYRYGSVAGRLDPRPFLKIWEPRYRKFLEVAGELHAQLQSEETRVVAEKLRAQFSASAIKRQGPRSAHVMIEQDASNSGRRSRPR